MHLRRQRQRIRTILLKHVEGYRGTAIVVDEKPLRRGAHRHLGNVTQPDESALGRANGCIPNGCDRGKGVIANRKVEKIIVFEPAHRCHDVGIGKRFRDIGQRQVHGCKLVRVYGHLNLWRLAAEDSDTPYALDAGQQRRDLILR